jgi:TonB family protein
VLETLQSATGGADDNSLLRFLDLVASGVLTRPELDHLWEALVPDRRSQDLENPAAANLRFEHRGVVLPQLVKQVNPVYPPAAQAAHLEGRVILLARINVDGTVGPSWVVRAAARVFAASAEEAVLARRYTPAQRNGEAIPLPFTIRVDFRLR